MNNASGRKPVSPRFTAPFLHALRATGREYEHHESSGLSVRVSASGRITFQFRYRRSGKKQRLNLGTHPLTSLKEARTRARRAASLLDDGKDPVRHEREQKNAERRAQEAREAADRVKRDARTVRDLADEWMARYVTQERRRPDHVQQMLYGSRNNQNSGILVTIGKLPLTEVTRRDIICALDLIVDRGARVQANRCASALKQMFQYGVERGLLERNVCADIRARTIGGTETSRSRVLRKDEIAALWSALNAHSRCKAVSVRPAPGRKLPPEEKKEVALSRPVALAIQLLLVTGQRRCELSRAEWLHIDLLQRSWLIPANNAKNGHTHTVPLSSLAIELLLELRALGSKSRFLIPSAIGDKPITEHAITRGAARLRAVLGIGYWVPHDLRRTVATQLADLGVLPHVIEKILNHTMQGVMAVYNRHEYLAECQQGMDLWSQRLRALTQTGPLQPKDDRLLHLAA